MMISSIFVAQRVTSITYICGSSRNLNLNHLLSLICLKMFFYDSGAPAVEHRRRPSPTFSNNSGRSALVDSVNALVEEGKKSRESKEQDLFQLKFNEEKLKMQVSRNYDENVKRLIEVKHQLESETNPGVKNILVKYEKKLTKVVDFSSSSDSGSEL